MSPQQPSYEWWVESTGTMGLVGLGYARSRDNDKAAGIINKVIGILR